MYHLYRGKLGDHISRTDELEKWNTGKGHRLAVKN